jgi:hypothetical protein
MLTALAVALALVAAPSRADAGIGPGPATTGAEPGDGELEALRRAEAELPAGPDGDEAREALLLDIGRAERRRYDATGDAAHLSKAQDALRQHLELAKRRGTLTEAHRLEVEAELTALDNLSGWAEPGPADPAAAVSTAPPPVPIVAVAPAPAVAPPPPPVPPDPLLDRRRKVAEGVAITGAVFLGVGGAAWVFLAAPAIIAAEIAENRADDGTFLVEESELYARAERRRNFARVSFYSGLGGVVVGGALLGAGLGVKAKTEREMSRPRASLHLLPSFGRQGAGATLVLRH